MRRRGPVGGRWPFLQVEAGRGRNALVMVDEVDVAVLVERAIGAREGDEVLPMPVVIRSAQQKSPAEIHEEILRAQEAEVAPGTSSLEGGVAPWLRKLFFRFPAWLRDLLFWRLLLRSPVRFKETMGTVVVSAVGMAAPGVLAWGIPFSLHPLTVGVGGIGPRRTESGRQDVLAFTVIFDHAVTDGAPVGRFIRRLSELLNHGQEWDGGGSPPSSTEGGPEIG